MAGLQAEGGSADTSAATGGSASPPAAASGSNGQVEGVPSVLCQEKVSAEASCPAPGTETRSGLFLPVEDAAGSQEARTVGYSQGPVVLGLLPTGKGVDCMAGLRT